MHNCPSCSADCDCDHPGSACVHLCLQLADEHSLIDPKRVLWEIVARRDALNAVIVALIQAIKIGAMDAATIPSVSVDLQETSCQPKL